MAVAAHRTVLKITGDAVAVVTEATTMLAANEYQVTDATRRIMDPDTAINVFDNGSPVLDVDVTINYLFAKVKKVSGNFTGPVTVTYSYLPTFSFAEARSFEINLTANLLETTLMADATAVRSRIRGLFDASGSVGSLDNLLTDLDAGAGQVIINSIWSSGSRRVIEITFPTSGVMFKAFIKFSELKEAASVDGLLESTMNWQLDAAKGTDQTEQGFFGFSSGGPDGY